MKKILSKSAWLTFVLLMIASLTLTSCNSATTTTAPAVATITKPTTSAAQTVLTPQSGGILRIVPRLTSQTFGYPGDMAMSVAVEVSAPCLESLCGLDPSGEFMPTKLATAYQVAQDGKSITFTLRKGVKFHDGSDFNSTAAKWNLEQMKKARIAGTDSWTTVVDVIDDYTVRLNLKQYTTTFMGQLASISRISSPSAFEKMGVDKIHTNPVGTGPFKFVSFTPDVGIKWERNDDYWGGKPYLDGIETIYITDEMAKSAALQSKGVDILFNVTSEIGVALKEKGYNVFFGGQETLVCMVPDSANADSPLSNMKVRQAIEYALDRNALKELGNGFWVAANQPSTPNTPGYIQDFVGRQYDPQKAKQLLTEAGYANGFTVKVVFSQSNLAPADTMTAVQQFLSKVGITADLQQMPSTQRTDISMNGWSNGFLITNIYSSLNYLSGLNYNLAPGGNLLVSTARPDGFGDLLNQATTTMDVATAVQLSQKIDILLYETSTIIPLWVAPQVLYVQQTNVHDAGLYSTGAQYDWTPEKAWISK